MKNCLYAVNFFLSFCHYLIIINLSYLIAGFTINRLCWFSNRLLAGKVAPPVAKGISTAIGLAAIPFIVTPIDTSVDWLMNRTYRRWLMYSDRLSKDHIVLHHRND